MLTLPSFPVSRWPRNCRPVVVLFALFAVSLVLCAPTLGQQAQGPGTAGRISHTHLTNRRIGSKLIVGVSNGKRHTPNTLYCNAVSVLVALVLGFHISGYEVTARDLRLCDWLKRPNAITEAFFGLDVRHILPSACVYE